MSRWRGVLVGGGGLLAVAGAGLALGSAPFASGQGGASLGLSPASQNVPVGTAYFEVDVNVADVDNLGAYEFTMKFDPDVVEYVGVADQGWLGSTGRNQACFEPQGAAGQSAVENVNENGAFKFGCSTNGLISAGQGKQGPDGSGTLATVAFKAKAVGQSDLTFEGQTAGVPYVIDGEGGYTALAPVESCTSDGCGDALNLDADINDGVVAVIDPNAPTPTGVPATPTQRPAQQAPDIQATVRAISGTPMSRLATPAPGTVGASSGSGGSSGGRPRTGTVAGSSGGAATGADGAPVAGYGPQEEAGNPWPMRAGVAMALGGVLAASAGWAARRRQV